MGKERRVIAPYFMPEIPMEPACPPGMTVDDVLKQTLSLLIGLRGDELRVLKVDHLDRLLTCPSGDEANRVTQTRGLAAALPVTVVLQADTVAWSVWTVAGGIEVDPQDAGGVSLGAFTIPFQVVFSGHIPCAQVVLTADVWSPAPASHWLLIEWRRA